MVKVICGETIINISVYILYQCYRYEGLYVISSGFQIALCACYSWNSASTHCTGGMQRMMSYMWELLVHVHIIGGTKGFVACGRTADMRLK